MNGFGHSFSGVMPQSLVVRVYILTSLTLVLFVGLGIGLFYQFQFRSSIAEAQDSASMMIGVAGQVITESAVIGDYDTIRRTLDKTIQHSRFEAASFIDVKGGVIQTHNTHQAFYHSPIWLREEIGKQLFDVNQLIRVGGVDYGVLRLQFSVSAIADELWKLFRVALFFSLMSVASGLLLIWIPLRRWLGAVERVRHFEENMTVGVNADEVSIGDVPLEVRPMFEVLAHTSRSLREKLRERETAMASLRQLIESLLPACEGEPTRDSNSLEVISRRIGDLVKEREAGRQALKNQKFALDQHAIVSMCDAQGRIVYANDRFCSCAGYSRDELIGSTYGKLKSGVHDENFYRELWDTVLKGQVWQGEICNLSRAGEQMWFASTIVPLASGEKGSTQFISICTDISPLKRAESALQKAKETAEAANRSKSGFLANMSHEIRTPMNGIIGMTDLALETELNSQQRDYLLTVKSSADALLTIINDILDITKIEAGKVALEEIAFDLYALLKDVVKLLMPKVEQKALLCEARIAPDVPQWVKGDPVRIRQVLLNLVGNAVKFTQTGEVILSATRVNPDEDEPGKAFIRFAVKDTGIGISSENLKHIFEAFTQEDISTTRKFGGTGLGLSISKRLVELMNGRLWVESERDKGSVFSFELTLPLTDRQRELLAVQKQLQLDRKRDHPIDVLLVEDNMVNQRLAQVLLQREGCKVEWAENGAKALSAFETSHFDVIFMDMQMPVMDGLEATQEIRRLERVHDKPRTRIIAMTANAMETDRKACLDAGMDDYISKPVKVDQIREMLDRWVRTDSLD